MLLVSFHVGKTFFFKEGIFDKWCVIISYYFKKFHLISVHFHQKSSSTSNCMDMKITLHEWVKPRSEVAHKLNKAKTNLSICVANPLQFPLFFISSLPKKVSIILVVFCFFLHFHFTVQTNLISGNSPQKLIIQTFSFLMI